MRTNFFLCKIWEVLKREVWLMGVTLHITMAFVICISERNGVMIMTGWGGVGGIMKSL